MGDATFLDACRVAVTRLDDEKCPQCGQTGYVSGGECRYAPRLGDDRWGPTCGFRDPSEARPKAEPIARAFHEAYERLAPSFGYATREASAKPWESVPAQNKALMIATAGEVLDRCLVLSRDAGDQNVARFTLVHQERTRRLERILDFLTRIERAEALTYEGPWRKDLDALLWGIPCAGCGCAESLCCCDQSP